MHQAGRQAAAAWSSQCCHTPEEVLPFHDLVWRQGLLSSHEDKHLDAEGLAGRARPLQVCHVVLNQLLWWLRRVEVEHTQQLHVRRVWGRVLALRS